MTERDASGRRPPEIQINYTEPRIKPPPLLEVGTLAWIRKNLLGSWLDVLLTVLGVVLVVSFVVGLIQWIIQDGNWFSIMFSLRTYITGRLDPLLLPRVNTAMLFVMFTIGATTAAYTRRLPPILPALIVLAAAVLVLLPPLIKMTIPQPEQYLTAGNVGIVSGTAKEVPVEKLAFVARKDEVISLRLANDAGYDDRLANLSGLVDRALNTLRNASANRFTSITRGQELLALMISDVTATEASNGELSTDMLTPSRRLLVIEEFLRLQYTLPDDVKAAISTMDDKLKDPLLTDDQRTKLVQDKEKAITDNATVVIPPLVADAYQINLVPVQVAITDAEGKELLAPTMIEAAGVVTFTVPADGWYILQKTVTGDKEGIGVMAAQGIYPLFQVGDNYARVIDNYEWTTDPPKDKDVKWITLLENRYRGERPLDEFLRLYVSPFLEKIRNPILAALIAISLGFAAARALDQQFSPLALPRKESLRLSNWLLMATPFLVFLLINGIDTLSLMSALSWLVGMYWAYHLGMWLYDQFAGQTLLRLLGLMAVTGITSLLINFIPVLLYNDYPTSPAYDFLLALPVGLMFFMGLVTGSGEQPRVVRQRVFNIGLLVVVLYVVPIFIARFLPPDTASSIQNVLPYTDSNTWGGLLLSLLITLYGIIFAFPIGILLALGRRSKLPAIRYPSTFIIETVRGTPFIVVLFAGQFLITFLHPSFQNIPAAYRALASTVIFVAAYLAENVRGGLQAIPSGQYEAGRALGIPEWQITLYVTLPQALRAVIPALVGMFISLFKDTSLLEIVSLSDLSRGVALMVSQAEFRESRQEGLIFITIIYFSISYVMAFVSRRIEESGAGAARRI